MTKTLKLQGKNVALDENHCPQATRITVDIYHIDYSQTCGTHK